LAHKVHLSHTVLLMLEILGTQKCWARVVSMAVCPEWVPSWNCLTNVWASDLGMAIQSSANFHYEFGRKFPSSVLNQACSWMGPIQLRGMGTRQPSEQLRLIPLWGLPVWPPCQLSSFPEQLLYLPFGALNSI
jgi:hypothetical protein